MEIFPSFGGASFLQKSKLVIRLILKGCSNRPFFHISVQEVQKDTEDPVIEQLGNYDPLPNSHNEKLVALNFQRLEYWLRKGAEPTESVQKLLGLCGYFPVHPESIKDAFLRRRKLLTELQKLKIEAAKLSSVAKEKSEKSSSSESSDSSDSSNSDNTASTENESSTAAEESPSNDAPDNDGPSRNAK